MLLIRYVRLDQERVLPLIIWFEPVVREEQSVGSGLRSWEVQVVCCIQTNDAKHFIQWSGVAQRSAMKGEIRNVYRE